MYKSIFKLFLTLLVLAPFGVQSQSFDKNFYACNNGYATCNQSLLTDVQKQQVHQSALSRNYYACNNGYATCNQSLLTDVQKQQVHQSALSRNYYACNNGYATCNQSLLTDVQKQQVHQSALSRNYYACNNGYATCNQSLLTDVQKQEVDLRRINSELKSNNSLVETNTGLSGSRPICAENGSCYGDISNITGLPKTTHVNGYYRKDGTYVRGHYRSRR